ncbi:MULTISPECIES: hypothetical protein [Pseudomonas]|uniref:Uncharacterized protein n=1 Tax=Pseudomonas putida (strain DOT-T1E) TaxID=1196325 RepID=I7BZY7_PSEPT|nr:MULTISPECIES: hypothetical protein [Pseudomonas]AFO49732.1 hypothetical protein T1E_3902 [Pseudomonas putida DOT-T1E]UZM95332.1 hypothetical protein OPZ46_07895 [Pseudomonas putida DOT-T1E]WPO32244.1 hypothetical protein REH59_11520 [Pseudomonas sp. BO3-4]
MKIEKLSKQVDYSNAKLYAFEVAAALGVAAAVVGIVTGISGFFSQAELNKKINEINDKLDAIIAGQVAIINELKNLGLHIEVVADQSWEKSYGRSLQSRWEQLEMYLAKDESLDPAAIKTTAEEYRELAFFCFNETVNLGQMGVAGFVSYVAGMTICFICYNKRSDKDSSISAARSFLDQINNWLSPDNNKSIVCLVSQTEDLIKTKRADLDDRPRDYHVDTTVSYWSPDIEEHCSQEKYKYITVDGDFDNGYTGRVRYEYGKERCRFRPIREPHGSQFMSLRDFHKGYSLDIVSGTVYELEGDVSVPIIPIFNQSEYAQVNTFNTDRIAIYQLMANLAQQKILQAALTDVRDTLLQRIAEE